MDEIVGAVVKQQERQAEALERLSAATEAIARDLWTLAAGEMKVTLVYPWASQPDVFRAVLVRDADEQRRLAEALPRFEKSHELPSDARGVYGEASRISLEGWLKSEHFKPIEIAELRLGKHDGMFKAPKTSTIAAPSVGAPKEIGELKLEREPDGIKLELESDAAKPDAAEPKLELESSGSTRAA